MRFWPLMFTLLAACNGDNSTDDGTDTDTDTTSLSAFETFIDVTEPVIGDLACYTAGNDWATMTWNEPTIDASVQTEGPATLLVEDFETEEPVPDSTVEIWLNDVASGTPDAVVTTGSDGIATFDSLPTCSPFAYRVSTDPLLDETKVTLAAHKILPVQAASGDHLPVDPDQNHAASLYIRLKARHLPVDLDHSWRITPLPEYAIIAGTAYDL